MHNINDRGRGNASAIVHKFPEEREHCLPPSSPVPSSTAIYYFPPIDELRKARASLQGPIGPKAVHALIGKVLSLEQSALQATTSQKKIKLQESVQHTRALIEKAQKAYKGNPQQFALFLLNNGLLEPLRPLEFPQKRFPFSLSHPLRKLQGKEPSEEVFALLQRSLANVEGRKSAFGSILTILSRSSGWNFSWIKR